MFLANQYPSAAISPIAMTFIVLAVVGGVGAWLALVYRADHVTTRESRIRQAQRQAGTATLASPVTRAEDEHSDAAGSRQDAAA